MDVPIETKLAALQQMIDHKIINQFLYKYRAAGEYTEKIFTEHTIWFAHPECFEDINDCLANVKNLDRIGLNNLIERSSLSDFEKAICKLGAESYNVDMYKEASNNITRKRIGIGCFCKTEKSDIMWSKYSDDHKGMCLQFDVLADPELFTLAKPVNYVDVLPEYNHFTDSNDIVNKVILTKTKDWQHEQEIRVVKGPSEMKTKENGQPFSFNPLALTKVIFGCKASNETINKYKELCKNNKLEHVRFSQMYPKDYGRFELEEKSL